MCRQRVLLRDNATNQLQAGWRNADQLGQFLKVRRCRWVGVVDENLVDRRISGRHRIDDGLYVADVRVDERRGVSPGGEILDVNSSDMSFAPTCTTESFI